MSYLKSLVSAVMNRAPESEPVAALPPNVVEMGYSDPLKEYSLEECRTHASGLSIAAAADSHERQRIREFARDEIWTRSPMLSGMVDKYCNSAIGAKGPRLKLTNFPEVVDAVQVQADFHRWAKRMGLVGKMRIALGAEAVDGESIAKIFTNPKVAESPFDVALDLQIIEAEQAERNDLNFEDDDGSGGIRYDEFGNPTAYPVLKDHPGDTHRFPSEDDYEMIDEKFIVHLFRSDRAGQKRGVSQFLQSLPLSSLLRRYTLSAVKNAEVNAKHSGVLEADGEFEDSDGNFVSPYTTASGEPWQQWWKKKTIAEGSLLCLPEGLKLKTFDATHPQSTYSDFKRSLAQEAANCLSMPYAMAANDISKVSFASAMAGNLPWGMKIRTVRQHLECDFLEKITRMWLRVYFGKRFGITQDVFDGLGIDFEWYWDNQEPVRRAEDATADMLEIAMGAKSVEEGATKRGNNFDDVATANAERLFDGDRAAYFRWVTDNMAKHSAQVATVSNATADV